MRKGYISTDNWVSGIIGIIILVILLSILIIFFSNVIELTKSAGCEDFIKENQKLREENEILNDMLQKREIEISQLIQTLLALNTSLSQKEKLIVNMSNQVTNLTYENKRLQEELKKYKEKKYVQEIYNYFYNISNSVANINQTINTLQISVSLLSVSILGLVIYVFFPVLLRRIKKDNKKISQKIKKKGAAKCL